MLVGVTEKKIKGHPTGLLISCARSVFGGCLQTLILSLLLQSCGADQDRGKVPARREPPVIDEERKTKQVEEDAQKSKETEEATPSTEEESPEIQLTTQNIKIPSLGADLYGVLTQSEPSQNLVILLHEESGNLHEFDELTNSVISGHAEVLTVDLRHGGNKFGFDNQTVMNSGGSNTSFASLVSDIEVIGRWAGERYTDVSVVASSVTAAALIKAARYQPSFKRLAVFSTPDYISEAGEAVYRYVAQFYKPIFVAASVSERATTERLLGGTIATQITRRFYESDKHGTALLQISDALSDFLAFLTHSP